MHLRNNRTDLQYFSLGRLGQRTCLPAAAMGLNEHREEVWQKYTSCVLKMPRPERCASRDRFRSHDCVLQLLASSRLSDRLHPAIVQVMDELREDWQPEEVALAFDAMENYAVNLLEYPWKKEFHTILVIYSRCDSL